MSKHQYNNLPAGRRLFAYWRLTKACYRYLNIATHHVLGAFVKVTVLAYFIFCALFLTLRYAVLPNIDLYKGDVERIASHAIGRPVSIGTIYASWKGLRPYLFLGGVVVHDKDGREALNLPGVAATLSWWSLARADVSLYSLEISRPDMDMQRDADGKLFVAGILIDTSKSDDGKGADWVLSQREILIRDGRLRWNDARRGAPELALTGVNLVLRNSWQHHQFALKATPPAGFASPLDIRARFDHPSFARKVSDPTRWKGELYTDLQNTDLAVWKTYADYPIEIQRGTGAVRAWLNFDHAKVADFTADLTLSSVFARLAPDLPPLDLVKVNGRVSVREEIDHSVADGTPTFGSKGHVIALSDFSLETTDGLALPLTTISESYTPAKKDQPEKTEVSAKVLDLQTLANFVERLPVPAAQRQMFSDFSPRGQVKDFAAHWLGAYPDVSAYDIKGQFTDLALRAQAPRPARPKGPHAPAQAAVPGIPGFENLSGRVDATDRGGSFSLASKQVKFNLPGYFADPEMLLDQLTMRASWTFQEKDRLLLDVSQMDFVQGGLSGSFTGKHLRPLSALHGKALGTLDLVGRINGFELNKVGQYLPLNTPDQLRRWLTGALVGGTLQDATVRVHGDLADFPFHTERPNDKPKGEFRVAGKIEQGALNYAPGLFGKDGKMPFWPLLEEIKGSIVFDRTRMEIKGDSARTHGAALSNVKAVIPNLATRDLLLEIDGSAAASLQDFLRYVNDSPVNDWIARFTEESKGSGDAKLALKLQLPLAHLIDSKVQGTLQFADNDVTLQEAIPPLLRTSGKLEFNEKGFNLNGIKAAFLGGPVAVSGGGQREAILIKADGTLNAEGLRKNYAAPAMLRLLSHLQGSTRYTTAISVKKGRTEIAVESALQGIALDFPAPLRKAANENFPLKFELAALPADDGNARDEMRIALGSSISARYERQKSAEKNAEWRVLRGGIGVNVPAPMSDSGLMMNFSMNSLNLGAWGNLASAVIGSDKPGAGGASADTLNIAQYVEPEILAARAGELIVLDKKWTNVVVGASHQKKVWQANIDSEQASGYVTWNESQSGLGLGKVTARLASFILPKSAASEVTELLEGKSEATQIPALDIIVENFELFGKRFGHLEMTANNVRVPSGREWRINRLSIVNPDVELKATGNWSSKDGGSLSSLNYALDIADAGKLLERFGFANVLRGGKGKMDGEVSWKGLPFALDIPSLSGQFNLNIASGQFLKEDPGALKLLGVLSLQSLPRRLTLDFRDVFSEGFAFDGITGTVNIAQGVARTDNFKMRSALATVLMDGSADVANESQSLHAVVIPEINAGAASVVYALAVNPVIGVGSFLAQLFLREPLARAFTHEYKITGPWKDPVVTKVERKFDIAPKAPGAPADSKEKTG